MLIYQPTGGIDQAPEGRLETARGASPGETERKRKSSPGGAADCSASLFSTADALFSVAPPGLESSLISRGPTGLTPRANLCRRSAAPVSETRYWTRVIQKPESRSGRAANPAGKLLGNACLEDFLVLSSLTHCHEAEVCSLQFDGIRESRGSWRSSTVEQLICNQQVAGSIPIASSNGEAI